MGAVLVVKGVFGPGADSARRSRESTPPPPDGKAGGIPAAWLPG